MSRRICLLFFLKDPAPPAIYTLSLHDALPISIWPKPFQRPHPPILMSASNEESAEFAGQHRRSEEHTSELQSRPHLECRLLLEKKKKNDMPDNAERTIYTNY